MRLFVMLMTALTTPLIADIPITIASKDLDSQQNSNMIRIGLELQNTSPSSIDLSTVKVRYPFSDAFEHWGSQKYYFSMHTVDWQENSGSTNDFDVTTLGTDDGIVGNEEIVITFGKRVFKSQSVIEIQFGVYRSNWSSIDETDDAGYSNSMNYRLNTNIVADYAPIDVPENPQRPLVVATPSNFSIRSYDIDNTSVGVNWRRVSIEMVNVSGDEISLGDVLLQYLLTENFDELGYQFFHFNVHSKDWSYSSGSINGLSMKIYDFDSDRSGNKLAEVSFPELSVPAEGIVELQFGIHRNDWANIDERNDPSYVSSASYVANPGIKIAIENHDVEDLINSKLATMGYNANALDENVISSTNLRELGLTLYTKKYYNDSVSIVITVDADGTVYDLEESKLSNRVAEVQRYGILSKKLYEEINSINRLDKKIKVVGFLDRQGLPASMPSVITNDNMPNSIEQWRQDNIQAIQQNSAYNRSLVAKIKENIAAQTGVTSCFIDLDEKTGIYTLEASVEMLLNQGIFENTVLIQDVSELKIETDLASMGFTMNVDNFHINGHTGSGITAAVWEANAPNFSDQMAVDGYRFTAAEAGEGQHMAYMLSAIKNNRTNKTDPNAPTTFGHTGYAPDAQLLCANYPSSPTVADIFGGLNWAVTQGASVVNMSFHTDWTFTFDEGGITYGFRSQQVGDDTWDDKYIDAVAGSFPFPTIVQAVGNLSMTGEFVNHKGYNTVVVGQDVSELYDMATSSVWINPSNGQELPHVTARVSNTTGVSVFDNSSTGTPVVTANGGTSLAAAMTTGFTATLQSINPSFLQFSPWTNRAILIASADNIEGPTWDSKGTIDQTDGAGRINGINAYFMAINPYQTGEVAKEHGFYSDQIVSGSTYNKTISITAANNGNLRIALSWFGNVNTTNFVSTLSDLDLELTGPNVSVSSKSLVNPVEMIVINNAVAGSTYQIKISTASAVTYDTNFGVAWINR